MERTKLELMLLHLLNERSPEGKKWKSIELPGLGKFTREDLAHEILTERKRQEKHWYQFWR